MMKLFCGTLTLTLTSLAAVAGTPDAGPALGPYKVTEHGTQGHRNLACDLLACDHLVGPITGQLVLSTAGGVDPGERVCLRPGVYTGRVKLLEVLGTAAAPVEVTNCGGQVLFQGVQEPILAERSVHFKVLGNGHQSALYGLKVVDSSDAGVKVRHLSRDFEIAWIEFTGSRGVAVKAKSEMRGNDLVTGLPFVQRGTRVHHLRSDYTAEHEAFYIGNTGCEPGTPFEDLPDAPLEDVFVHDNILLDSGADALQVGCAWGAVEIHRNYIKKAGYRPFGGDLRQRHGIQVGKSSKGKVFRNWVEDSVIDCIHAEGGHPDGIAIYNNVLKSCPQAVYVNTRMRFATRLVFANNTVIVPTGHGLRSSPTLRTAATFFQVHDNLFVGVEAGSVVIFDGEPTPRPLSALSSLREFVAFGQIHVPDAAAALFVDAARDDYRLMGDSPAVDAGVSTAMLGVLTDLRGLPRDNVYDVGALEYFATPPGTGSQRDRVFRR